MKFTPADFQNLLVLISSDQLTVRGNQVEVVAVLQHKLKVALQEAQQTAQEPVKDGDDSKPVERSSGRTEEGADSD